MPKCTRRAADMAAHVLFPQFADIERLNGNQGAAELFRDERDCGCQHRAPSMPEPQFVIAQRPAEQRDVA